MDTIVEREDEFLDEAARHLLKVFPRHVDLNVTSDPFQHTTNGRVVARNSGVTIAHQHVKLAFAGRKSSGRF